MGSLGVVRRGQKAPDFKLDAVVHGDFGDWSLYHHLNHDRWALLLYIPAAFSFVYPTEVLAFSNCIEEFARHQTSVAFISTDTKHVMWHWQELPRKHGCLGKCFVSLLADPSHHITRSWGILVENEGVALRGMFLVDPQAVVQHVTINNKAVGRSVPEALRLAKRSKPYERPFPVAQVGEVCDNNVTEFNDDILKQLFHNFGAIEGIDWDAKDALS